MNTEIGALRSALEKIASLADRACGATPAKFDYTLGAQHAFIEASGIARAALSSSPPPSTEGAGPLKLDTETQVFFYEQDFYVLSNFSSFRLEWKDSDFDNAEAAYHWEKFPGSARIRTEIRHARSAHEAFKIAQANKLLCRPDWDSVKVGIMRDILRAKAAQHEYVRRKLLQTGDRELIENSWRDDFWGWGPNRDGQNMLGKLWMEIRAELRAAPDATRTALAGVTAPQTATEGN